MIGRGLRLSPSTGKQDCLILDFVGNAGRHSLISTVDVLAGDEVSGQQKVLAKRRLEEQPDLDVQLALELAAEDLRRSEEATRRAAAEAAARAKVKYEAADVDPFAMGASEAAQILGVELYAHSGVPASQKQIETLRKFGVEIPSIGKYDASLLLDKLFTRVRHEPRLATYKQMRLLARNGIDGTSLTFDEASLLVEDLMKKWRGSRQIKAAQG